MSELNVVGKPVQRLDAHGHVTGRTVFMEDMNPPGMLHLKMHRSERHHARMTDVDTSAAEAVKGVVKVLTYRGRAEQLVHGPAADRRRLRRRAGAGRGPGALAR